MCAGLLMQVILFLLIMLNLLSLQWFTKNAEITRIVSLIHTYSDSLSGQRLQDVHQESKTFHFITIDRELIVHTDTIFKLKKLTKNIICLRLFYISREVIQINSFWQRFMMIINDLFFFFLRLCQMGCESV